MTTEVQTVGLGESGEQVQEVQARLRHLGYYQGEADGEFRDDTELALKEFQRMNGLEENGSASQETFDTLDREAQYQGYEPYTVRQNGYRAPETQQNGDGQQAGTDAGYGQDAHGQGQQAYGEQQAHGENGVGYEQDGYRWNGQEWEAIEGHANGHAGAQTNGQSGDQASVGYEQDGYRWNGQEWEPIEGHTNGQSGAQTNGQSGDQTNGQANGDTSVGYEQDGYRWNGQEWEPIQQPSGQSGDGTTAESQQPAAATDGQSPTAGGEIDPSIFEGDEFASFREFLEQEFAGQSSAAAA